MNHLSPELFWPSSIPFLNANTVKWPNLEVLDVRTGQETAAGSYWFRPSAGFPDDFDLSCWDSNSGDDSDTYSDIEEENRGRLLGMWPIRLYRVRPEPELFNALAVSIARAAYCMPKVKHINSSSMATIARIPVADGITL